MDTDLFTDELTPLTSVPQMPAPPSERNIVFDAALARLVDRVPGALPDDVIYTYANLRRVQIRLRQLVAAAKRRIAKDRRKIAKVRRHFEHLIAEIDEKQDEIRRYRHAISAASSLRSLIEQGDLCAKRPTITISGSE
jgi:hypothetical protein